jgi:peptidoglycan/LPS O-acetylase OafA/YrhL
MITLFPGYPSVGQKLEEFNGVGPGFDAWRIFLSISVLFLHTFFVCYGRQSEVATNLGYYGRPFFVAILPIFFGLSGFLVAASAERATGVLAFLWFRVVRLVPALAVETTLAAIILGPIVTTMLLRDYFSDRHFYAYFGNIIGRVKYNLPGVFAESLEPGIVNLNLWTLHAELACYIIMALAIFFGLLKKRKLLLGLWISVTVFMAAWNIRTSIFEGSSLYPTTIFVYSFCSCVVAYLWRDAIPVSGKLATLALLIYLGLVYLPQTVFLVIPLLTYIMIYVGLSSALKLKMPGDYSYGIYLYSFVITQTIAWMLPTWRVWWFIFPAALIASVFVSVFSWHLIERPSLRLKRLAKVTKQLKPAASQ